MNQKTRNQKTRNKKKQNLETSEKIRFSEKSDKIRKILKISDFQKKSEKFWNFQIFRKNLKISDFYSNLNLNIIQHFQKTSEKFRKILKIFRFSEQFWKFSDFQKKSEKFWKFQIFRKNLKISDFQKQSEKFRRTPTWENTMAKHVWPSYFPISFFTRWEA